SMAEGKLLKVEQQRQKLEIILSLLEAKLESIQWLAQNNPTANGNNNNNANVVEEGVPDAPSATRSEVPDVSSSGPSAPSAPEAIPLKDDSRYHKWFKFLAMKIPVEQLKQRMAIEAPHLDPSMLDLDPNFPAPAGAVHISQATALVLVEQASS